MATSKQPLARAWLRWFSSDPHLVGISAAAIGVDLTLLGGTETVLRYSFDALWWVVILGSYVVGCLVTGGLISIVKRQSLKLVFAPDVADSTWLERNRGALSVATIAMILLLLAVAVTVALIVVGLQDMAYVSAIVTAVVALANILQAWRLQKRTPPAILPPAPPPTSQQSREPGGGGRHHRPES